MMSATLALLRMSPIELFPSGPLTFGLAHSPDQALASSTEIVWDRPGTSVRGLLAERLAAKRVRLDAISLSDPRREYPLLTDPAQPSPNSLDIPLIFGCAKIARSLITSASVSATFDGAAMTAKSL